MLTLPIKKQWYDQILTGKKKIEYREIKPYWTSRLLKVTGIVGDPEEPVPILARKFNGQKKHFDVLFRNGYEPDSPSFIAECYVDIDEDDWDGPYYRIHIVRIKEDIEKSTKKADDGEPLRKKEKDRNKLSTPTTEPIRIIDNINTLLKEDLKTTVRSKSRLSIAAACFSMYAYNELKKQLESIDELRFIFTSPTFITEKAEKQKREFYIPRLSREQSLYGTEFEIKLRNEMTQKAIANALANKHLRINVRSMHPARYSSRMVAYGFFLELKGDTLESCLPYMGQLYQGSISSDGLNFVASVIGYRESRPKKDLARIELDARTTEDF